MSISVLTLLCVYIRYNALYVNLFVLYNYIFCMKVSKIENQFAKKPVLTSPFYSFAAKMYKVSIN